MKINITQRWMFMMVGLILILIGIVLPPQRLLEAALPVWAAPFQAKILGGLWCLKVAFLLNGSLLLFYWRLRTLWQQTAVFERPVLKVFRQNQYPWSSLECWSVAGILALSLGCRLVGANQSLTTDEIYRQQHFIAHGLPVILTYYPYCAHHVFYSLMAYFCELLPLPLEVAYRLPAILWGTMAVWLTHLLARRVFGRGEALLTTFLSGMALYGIFYSQAAQGYSATHCLVVMVMLGWIGILETPEKRGSWVMVGAGIVLLLYTLPFNIFLIIGMGVSGVILGYRQFGHNGNNFRLWLLRVVILMSIVGAIVFLLYSVQFPQLLEQLRISSTRPEEHLSVVFFRGWLMQLTFWDYYWPLSLCLVGLAVVGLASLAYREPNFVILTYGAIAVFLVVLGLKGSFIYPRYLIYSLPLFLMACIEGISMIGEKLGRAKGRQLGVAVLVIGITLINARVLVDYYRVGQQNVREACRFAVATAAPEDIIVSYGLIWDLFPFYDRTIKPLKNLQELGNIFDNAPGQVYLLYAYEHVLRKKPIEFNTIQAHMSEVRRWPGMLMDSSQRDGDVVVMKFRRKN